MKGPRWRVAYSVLKTRHGCVNRSQTHKLACDFDSHFLMWIGILLHIQLPTVNYQKRVLLWYLTNTALFSGNMRQGAVSFCNAFALVQITCDLLIYTTSSILHWVLERRCYTRVLVMCRCWGHDVMPVVWPRKIDRLCVDSHTQLADPTPSDRMYRAGRVIAAHCIHQSCDPCQRRDDTRKR